MSGHSFAGEKIRPNVKVPLPDNVNIRVSGRDVSEVVAALSGTWEGKWSDYSTETAQVVEEINSKEANIISCLGESSALYTVPPSCKRFKAVVKPENVQIEFLIGESLLIAFGMQKSLTQMTAIKKSPLDKMEIVMTRVK